MIGDNGTPETPDWKLPDRDPLPVLTMPLMWDGDQA